MFLLITHGKLEKSDPAFGSEHTPGGTAYIEYLTEKGLLLRKFDPKARIVGYGQRFKQLNGCIEEGLGGIPVEYDWWIGPNYSVIEVNKKKFYVMDNGRILSEGGCEEARRYIDFNGWEHLKKIESRCPDQNMVLCSGRQFMLSLGKTDSKSGNIYRIDTWDQMVTCITECFLNYQKRRPRFGRK